MVTKVLDRIFSTKSKKNIDDKKKLEIVSNLDKPSLAYEDDYKLEIVWKNVVFLTLLHIVAFYGFTFPKTYPTFICLWISAFMQGFGTTIGAHRLYTHRSFKANKKLQVLLIFMHTMALQNSVYEWVRDHRVHHKFVDTNADPHNSKRGFFFSHIGWLMCKKHPDVKKFGGRIDMSDLEADELVMFQHKYYMPLAILIGFVFPRWFCIYVLGQPFQAAFFGFFFYYLCVLHSIWNINSGAHFWGHRPYDKNASSTDSYLIGHMGLGEGWHNYHHCFPWDYKTAELPSYWFNSSLGFIDFFAWIGWATDLKTVSQDVINKRAERTGDGSHKHPKININLISKATDNHSNLWGWDDNEMTEEERKCVKILNKLSS